MKKEKILQSFNYILVTLLLLSSLIIFYYTDFSDTLDNSVMLFEVIEKGNLFNYYQYAAEHAHFNTVYTANYNVFLYFIFMLWNLPIILINKLYPFDYMNSFYALSYCKLLILTTTLLSSHILKKISIYLTNNKNVGITSQILFLSSACTIIPSMVACQYDSISLLFILLGLYGYLKNNKVLFYLSFVVAMPLKSFAIFIFIPLLLLKEKNIIKIILKTLLTLSFNILLEIPFIHNDYYKIAMGSQNSSAMDLILNSNISIAGYSLNIFLLLFGILCVYAYIHNFEKDENKNLKYTYIASVSISLFLSFTHIRSYWIILIVPFILLITSINKKNYPISLLLFIIGTSSFGIYILMNHWVYSTSDLTSKLFLAKYINFYDRDIFEYQNIYNFFNINNLTKYSTLLYTIFISSIISIFVINKPNSKDTNISYKSYNLELLQILITSCILLLLVYTNVVKNGYTIYNYQDVPVSYMNEDLYDVKSISQDFKVLETEELDVIYFNLKINKYGTSYRELRNAFKIQILDGNKVIASKILGVANYSERESNYVKFNKVKLYKGRIYTIKITPIVIREYENVDLYFQKTNTLQNKEFPMYINGKKQNYNLAIKVK